MKVPMIDLVMVGAGGDMATQIAVLKEMKKEGRIRYIGVHDLATPPYPPDAAFARLEAVMRSEPIDFVANFAPIGTWSAKFDPGAPITNVKVVKGSWGLRTIKGG